MKKETEKLIIGSRESLLAVRQSEIVMEYMRREHPEIRTELLTMKTTGDRILDKRLDQIGGKGLFVKELDRALLAGRTDLSVHCLKDMPMEIPEDLPVIGYSVREDPGDVLVLSQGAREPDLSKPIGTSSRRRILQARDLFPDARFESVRGNIQTRLRKLDEGQYGALILAAAGLRRLGLEERISRVFSPEEMIPSAGQGVLVLQGRRGRDYSFLDGFLSPEAALTSAAERAFVRRLGGGCTSPIAAFASFDPGDAAGGPEPRTVEGSGEHPAAGSLTTGGSGEGPAAGTPAWPFSGGRMTVRGFYYDDRLCRSFRKTLTRSVRTEAEAARAGEDLAAELLADVRD